MAKTFKASFTVRWAASDGKDGADGKDGKGISSANIYFAVHTSGTSAPTSFPYDTISSAEFKQGYYVWQAQVIGYTDGTSETTGAVCLGSCDDFASVTEQYAVGTESAAEGTWGTTYTPTKGKWLWQRTRLVYNSTDAESKYKYTPSSAGQRIGYFGEDGTSRGIETVTNYYLASDVSEGVTTSHTSYAWSTAIPTLDEENRYLWNYELTEYTDGTTSTTTPHVIGMYSADGTGIAGITEYWVASPLASGVTVANTSGWSTTVPTLDATNRYLWNYETTEYTDGREVDSDPHLAGMYTTMNNNLLKGTDFETGTDAWNTLNGTTTEGIGGVKAQKPTSVSLTSYQELAQQTIYNSDDTGVVEHGTVYTLSFYSKGNVTAYVYPSIVDTDYGKVVDGVATTTGADLGTAFTGSASEWTLHTITFKTNSQTGAEQNVLFRLPAGSAGQICMPKLEWGDTATAWCRNESDRTGAAGDGGVSVVVSGGAISAKKKSSAQSFYVYVSVMKGTEQMPYGDGTAGSGTFICSSMSTGSSSLTVSRSAGDTFIYGLKLAASAVVNTTATFNVTVEGVVFPQTVTFSTVEDGIQGMIVRTSEWTEGVTYHNDADLTTSPRYLDVVTITDTSGNLTGIWECAQTEKASSSNKPSTSGNTTYWTQMNEMEPIYTPLIIAENAVLRFSQTNRMLVMDTTGSNVQACFTGVEDSDDYMLWIGGKTASEANFKVAYNGNAVMKNVTIMGTVRTGFLNMTLNAQSAISDYNLARKLDKVDNCTIRSYGSSRSVILPYEEDNAGRVMRIFNDANLNDSDLYYRFSLRSVRNTYDDGGEISDTETFYIYYYNGSEVGRTNAYYVEKYHYVELVAVQLEPYKTQTEIDGSVSFNGYVSWFVVKDIDFSPLWA